MPVLVPTPYRHEIPCPHCGATIESPFGEGDLTGTGDSFSCPHCHKSVGMPLAERVDRIARREARRGQRWVVAGAVLLGFPVARAILRTPFPWLTPLAWVLMSALGTLLGVMAAFVVFHFRVDRVQGRLWQEIEPHRPAELTTRTGEDLDHS